MSVSQSRDLRDQKALVTGATSGIGDPGDDYGIGDVQTVYLPLRDMASPPPGLLDPVDATIKLSLPLAKLGMWPTADPNVPGASGT